MLHGAAKGGFPDRARCPRSQGFPAQHPSPRNASRSAAPPLKALGVRPSLRASCSSAGRKAAFPVSTLHTLSRNTCLHAFVWLIPSLYLGFSRMLPSQKGLPKGTAKPLPAPGSVTPSAAAFLCPALALPESKDVYSTIYFLCHLRAEASPSQDLVSLVHSCHPDARRLHTRVAGG